MSSFLFLHVGQLVVDLSVHERSPLASELRLQTLLDESADLLLGDRVEIHLAKGSLNGIDNHGIIRTKVTALEVERTLALVTRPLSESRSAAVSKSDLGLAVHITGRRDVGHAAQVGHAGPVLVRAIHALNVTKGSRGLAIDGAVRVWHVGGVSRHGAVTR